MAERDDTYRDRQQSGYASRERWNQDRHSRDERGAGERFGEKVRAWFGNEDPARPHDYERPPERWGGERGREPDLGYEYRGAGVSRPIERDFSFDPGDTDRFGDYERDERPRNESSRDWRHRQSAPSAGWRPRHDDAQGYRPSPGFEPGGRERDYPHSGYSQTWGGIRAGSQEWSTPPARSARHWVSDDSGRGWGPHAGRGPRGYQRSDDRIRDEVNDRLTADSHVDATDIEVMVQGAEVTLTGFVDSRAAKRAAEDLADDIQGVREVHNNLRIRSQAEGEGVGRTSVLGLTEKSTQTAASAHAADRAGSRTRNQ